MRGLYVAGYATGRLWVEALRIDPASELLGLRVNIWVSAVTLITAVVVLVVRSRQQPKPIAAAADAPVDHPAPRE